MADTPTASDGASGEGRYERSSLKAEAIRRGKVKISGPYPLIEGAEDALPKRHTGPLRPQTSLANTPLLQPPPRRHSSVDGRMEQDANGHLNTGASDGNTFRRYERSSIDEEPVQPGIQQRRTSPDMSNSYHASSILTTGANTPNPSNNMNTKKKKRKSGLKNVFRKMFGRKTKGGDKRESFSPKPEVVREESVPDRGAIWGGEAEVNDNRNDDLAGDFSFQELQPRTPLGSHLPFPMNVNAPEEASPTQEYIDLETHHPLHKRRATLPSLVFNNTDIATISALLNDDSKEQAADINDVGERRGSEYRVVDPQISIGVAYSSPNHLKRRSRSQSALSEAPRQISETVPGRTPRRRSAEIRYWRTSAMGRSITSEYSDVKSPSGEEGEDLKVSDSQRNSTTPRATLDEDQKENQITSFNFGDLHWQERDSSDIARSDHTPTMTDQSTVSYADTPQTHGAESGLCVPRHANGSGYQLHQTIPEEGSKTRSRSPNERASPRIRPAASHSSLAHSLRKTPSKLSIPAPAPTSLPSFLSSPSPKDESPSGPFPAVTAQSSSQSLRPPPSSDAAPLSPTKAAEQFAAIYTILKHERSARKSLEDQVLNLQSQITELHRTIAAQRISSAPPTSESRATTAGTSAPDKLPIQQPSSAGSHELKPLGNGRIPLGSGNDDERLQPAPITTTGPPHADLSRTNTEGGSEAFETPTEESSPYAWGEGNVGLISKKQQVVY